MRKSFLPGAKLDTEVAIVAVNEIYSIYSKLSDNELGFGREAILVQ